MDLAILRSYIREYRPVLIGVDGGADAILEAGLTPDMVIGDMDSVSDRALTCGAEIVVHAYRDGHAPGAERVRALGVEPVIFAAVGTSRYPGSCHQTMPRAGFHPPINGFPKSNQFRT